MLDPMSLRLEVALADIRGQIDFHDSLAYWHEDSPDPTQDWLSSLPQQAVPLTIDEEDTIVEIADCLADIVAPHGSVIHIYGDLHARVNVSGHCEVIVAGDVLPAGSIHGDGIVRIYIAGSLLGEVHNRRSSKVWVRGDMRGRIGTGEPSTSLHIFGDCTGSISPVSDPALLYLDVGRFMPFELVEKTAAVAYTEFHAVVRQSDKPAGIYPDRTVYKMFEQHRSYNRWVVIEQRTASPA
jgi:hypothetical protein